MPRLLGPLSPPPNMVCEVASAVPRGTVLGWPDAPRDGPPVASGQDPTGRAGKACHRDLGLYGRWEPHLDTATETSAVNLLPAFLSGRPSSLGRQRPCACRSPQVVQLPWGSPSPPIGCRGQPPSSQPLRPLQSLGPMDRRSEPSSLAASSTGQSCLVWPWAWGLAPEPLTGSPRGATSCLEQRQDHPDMRAWAHTLPSPAPGHPPPPPSLASAGLPPGHLPWPGASPTPTKSCVPTPAHPGPTLAGTSEPSSPSRTSTAQPGASRLASSTGSAPRAS